MCKLVSIKSSANIHENCCHNELLRSVSAAHDVLTKEAEKRKLIALPSKTILDMDSNSGHKSIEATIIWMVHTFHHALHNVRRPKCCVSKNRKRKSCISRRITHDANPSPFVHQPGIVGPAIERIGHSEHSVWKECTHRLISVNALVAFVKIALIHLVLRSLVAQASRSSGVCHGSVYQTDLVWIWGPIRPEHGSKIAEIRHPCLELRYGPIFEVDEINSSMKNI